MKCTKLPDIEEGDVFKLTIQHEPIEVPSDGVNKEKALAFDVRKQTEGLNANAIAERIGKSVPTTTERYLINLRKAGLIEFRGAPKTGGYFVINKQ